MRLLVQHNSEYHYGEPTALGPHLIRLTPAPHTRARVERYRLEIAPRANLRWQQDPLGNRVARISFEAGVKMESLRVAVELALDLEPVNPFDFFLDEQAEQLPFTYSAALEHELAACRDVSLAALHGGPLFEAFVQKLPRTGKAVDFLTAYNEAVHSSLRYVIRNESGIWTPEETLANGRGSCRDFAVLLMAMLRRVGLATRFASGYLIQLKDEGMLPDQPRGVSKDVVDLHAWAEIFLPGAGWVGLDATSGLWCGEGHIPLACTADPALASPVEGTAERVARSVDFSMSVVRLEDLPRTTAPFPEEVWKELLMGADKADAVLTGAGLTLTSGGEPTFISREQPALPEWNGAALGESKWLQGLRLTEQLRSRLARGSAVLHRMGKHYPGESLPRWSLELCSRTDGRPLWQGEVAARADTPPAREAAAKKFMHALAEALGVSEGVSSAYEDPWHFLEQEAQLPIDVDPLSVDLGDSEERKRLARVLDRGLGAEAGYVLPLTRKEGVWRTDVWTFRRGRLFLLPGDSPLGLRLPLASLGPSWAPEWDEKEVAPKDPRRGPEPKPKGHLRTALAVEVRQGILQIFLPPLPSGEDFIALVEAIDRIRSAQRIPVMLEGYAPAPSPLLKRFAVTPDPGVLEVNIPPSTSGVAHAHLLEQVFDAALHAGLHSEKFLLDGRIAGSGGGHHLTAGGPEPLKSPLVQRPDLLASLLTFIQHHPSLSYLFNGLFVGPTSQAPRVDEARDETLYELQLSLEAAFDAEPDSPPWLGDSLFRNLLVDVSGNTHRAEVCLDKLFDWRTPHGRQGLVELRAFEMPPHPRMAAAQALLLRSLLASFVKTPYRRPLVRWGSALHDRFLLPHALWQDFEQVLAHLSAQGVPLPTGAFRAFLELRCPRIGQLSVPGVTLTLRNALEPWPVLGEEPGSTGTSRFVDSSVERVELIAEGFESERHVLLVNGLELPLTPTGTQGERAAGVRFRAWSPAYSLQPQLGIHGPLHFELVDRWTRRGLTGGTYHVWHPEGRAYDTPPLTLAEAAARRNQRFTQDGTRPAPISWRETTRHPENPFTLDLRRFPGDRPFPEAEGAPEATPGAKKP